MTQYFVESKTKQPQLFCFSQILEVHFDDIQLISSFQEDFDQRQQKCWLKYWANEGEELIFQAWNDKYKDYLIDNVEIEKTNELNTEEKGKVAEILKTEEFNYNAGDNHLLKTDEFNRQEILPKDSAAVDICEFNHNPVESQSYTWDGLWEQHRDEIYVEQYYIFTTIFYNYFLDIKNSLADTASYLEDILDEQDASEPQIVNECLELTEELEQIRLLGLPTSFGGRPQYSSKKSKKHDCKNLHFSDFFSESDIEEASSDSEMEECSQGAAVKEDSSLHTIQQKAIAKTAKKPKKKNRKLKNVPSFILEEKGLLKYWRKRFSLFSRFDEGIRLDRESWFSVTPEKVAQHLAVRLKCNILVDGFCGSGGNAIQFAHTCDKVIAIDIDPVKLEMAKHNAEIYNVAHKIEFILGDFLQIASWGKLQADTVFLSPPWGGPKYKNKKDYDIEKYLLPVKATDLVAVSRNVSDNVALFLPRNSNVKQIVRLAGVGNRCEIEHNYLDSRLVAVTALYGEEILQKKSPTT